MIAADHQIVLTLRADAPATARTRDAETRGNTSALQFCVGTMPALARSLQQLCRDISSSHHGATLDG
jgi:hypothetical protein